VCILQRSGVASADKDYSQVDVDVAQRYSVLIEMDQAPGAYKFHAELLKDMFGMRKKNLITEQYAVLRYGTTPSTAFPPEEAMPPSRNTSLKVLDPLTLRPLHAMAAPASTEQETLEVSFGLTSDSVFRSFINGSSWENEGLNRKATLYDLYAAHQAQKIFIPEEFLITKPDYSVLDLIINNLDEGDHALHLHGHSPFVLGSGVGFYQHSLHPQWGETLDLTQNFTNPMRRDVFVVPAYGWVVIRIILDNPGIWALHCHVAWHLAVGFMAQLNVQPSKQLQRKIPLESKAQCRY
jgi:FtsP/CotA-like multicopper oxidase with cupredoxin domain